MSAKLIWATPNGDDLIAHIARVSNPENQDNKETAPRLLRYLIRKKHWSPFEMVNACVEVETTRDIGRQLLRHRSLSFQEFSGRYAAYLAGLFRSREARLQDHKNRQASIQVDDLALTEWWDHVVRMISLITELYYHRALRRGIAKEVARSILPEGLVPSKIYVNGTLRSWIHYWDVRCTPETQKEHRELAEATREAVLGAYPGLREILLEKQPD